MRLEPIWYTQQTNFLSQLSDTDRNDLLSLGREHAYKKHELIFMAGAPGEYVYILKEGRAKIYQLSPSGKEIILWFCFPGELFGMAEISRGGQRDVCARACSPIHVLKIPQLQFKEYLASHNKVAMLTVDLLSCRLRVLGDLLSNMTSEDVMSRLIKLFTRLTTRYGIYKDGDILIDIKLTHQDIADMIGASRQTVSTTISNLKKQGFLTIENHCIHIKNSETLFNFGPQGSHAISQNRYM